MRGSVFWIVGAVIVCFDAVAAEPDPLRAAREALHRSHGGGSAWMVLGERFEYAEEADALDWEGQGWHGVDEHKLWVKTEIGYHDADFEELELQALYSPAIEAFWDLQLGIRHAFEPDPSRTYAVIGLHGLAPYWLEVDGALFLSDEGDLSARVEAEYDVRLTRKWLLQPRVEINASASRDRDLGRPSGFRELEVGLRLRYEITPMFAPYLGVTRHREKKLSLGVEESTSFVAGLRFWF